MHPARSLTRPSGPAVRETPLSGGGRLACRRIEGPRETVLLLHGNSSCGAVFDRQVAALTGAGFGVIVPDLPGHGLSEDADEPAATYSFPGHAAAVEALLDALGVARCAAVGWSLGGHVAMELAATSRRVAALLVTGAPPVKPSPEALTTAFRTTPDMGLAGKPEFSEADARAYAQAMLGGPERVTRELLAAVKRTDGRARFWMLKNGVDGVGIDQAAFAADSPLPFAIVQGTEDPFLEMGYLRSLAFANIWRGAPQWLDGVGHAPHWEAPDGFDALLLAFLRDARIGS